jgi:hypothetical protein
MKQVHISCLETHYQNETCSSFQEHCSNHSKRMFHLSNKQYKYVYSFVPWLKNVASYVFYISIPLNPIVLREHLTAKSQSRMGEWGTPARRLTQRAAGSRLQGWGEQHVASGTQALGKKIDEDHPCQDVVRTVQLKCGPQYIILNVCMVI